MIQVGDALVRVAVAWNATRLTQVFEWLPSQRIDRAAFPHARRAAKHEAGVSPWHTTAPTEGNVQNLQSCLRLSSLSCHPPRLF